MLSWQKQIELLFAKRHVEFRVKQRSLHEKMRDLANERRLLDHLLLSSSSSSSSTQTATTTAWGLRLHCASVAGLWLHQSGQGIDEPANFTLRDPASWLACQDLQKRNQLQSGCLQVAFEKTTALLKRKEEGGNGECDLRRDNRPSVATLAYSAFRQYLAEFLLIYDQLMPSDDSDDNESTSKPIAESVQHQLHQLNSDRLSCVVRLARRIAILKHQVKTLQDIKFGGEKNE